MIPQIVGGILRHVLTVFGGSLVTKGLLDNEQLASGIGALLTILGLAWSIWQKSRARTEPGGDFNPNAEVRRAQPVNSKPTYDPHRKGGFNKGGYVQLPALVAGAIWLGLFLLIVFIAGQVHANDARKNPDVTITPDLTSWRLAETSPRWSGFGDLAPTWSQKEACGGVTYAEWLKFTPPVDGRPFFVRLLFSLRPWGEVGTDKGKMRVDKNGATASATYRDGERPSKADLMPQSAAVGFQGGADY